MVQSFPSKRANLYQPLTSKLTLKHPCDVFVPCFSVLMGTLRHGKDRSTERASESARRAGVQSEGQISLDSCSVCSGPTTSTCVTAATSHMTTTRDGALITHTNDKNRSRVNKRKQRMLVHLEAAEGTAVALTLSLKHPTRLKGLE